MRFKKSFIICIIALILLNIYMLVITAKNNNNISKYFRVHVVANSDSIDDQLLKYKLAKQLDTYISTITTNSNSKQESKQIVKKNIQNILNMCNNIIIANGYDYELKAYIGKLHYDEKQKEEIYMASGLYDSLKLVIGNGEGNNWWSLIYPTSLNNAVTENSNTNINSNNNNIEYKLYIIEWFKELFSN